MELLNAKGIFWGVLLKEKYKYNELNYKQLHCKWWRIILFLFKIIENGV